MLSLSFSAFARSLRSALNGSIGILSDRPGSVLPYASFRLVHTPSLLRSPTGPGILLPLLLSGCGTLTGLDAGSTFNCGQGEGVPCTSVESIAVLHAARSLPHQTAEHEAAAAALAAEASRSPSDGGAVASAVLLDVESSAEAPSRGNTRSSVDSSVEPAGKAAQEPKAKKSSSAVSSGGSNKIARPSIYGPTPALGAFPRRIPEAIVRLWIAPWTDDRGVFHTAETLYVTVREARWADARERRPAPRPAVRLGAYPTASVSDRAARRKTMPWTASASAETDTASWNGLGSADAEANGNTLRRAAEAFRNVLEDEGKSRRNDRSSLEAPLEANAARHEGDVR